MTNHLPLHRPSPNVLYNARCVAVETGVALKEIRKYCEATQRTVSSPKNQFPKNQFPNNQPVLYQFTKSEFYAIVAEIRYLKRLAPNRSLTDMVCPCPVFGDIGPHSGQKSYFTIQEICEATGWNDTSAKRFCGQFLSSNRDPHVHHRFDEELFRKIVDLFRFLRIVSPASPLRAYYRLKGISASRSCADFETVN